MLFVNVYQKQKRYGGPEEGGWYYDAWEPVQEWEREPKYEDREVTHPHNPEMKWNELVCVDEGLSKPISKPALNEAHAERIAQHLEKIYSFDSKDYSSVDSRKTNYEIRIEDHKPQAGSNYHPYE
jgi:hypothetical protein